MKRYDGRSGSATQFPEPPVPLLSPVASPAPPPQRKSGCPTGVLLPGFDPGSLLSGLGGLESEDLLLLLILWLLYRESGDVELLIIMAAMYLF